ncbi:hypothetical protein IAD21_05362 [Abditibacteriota bacterium]|nr:hypothetical protein IAD21_05362 [Abditibacteriota bacterium]
MTTLILPPRYSDDSNTLWRTAIRLGWNIERLQSWRVPAEFCPGHDVAIYGESLWANFVAEQLGLKLYEPPLDWLARLAHEFVGRKIEFCTLEEAREKQFPLFVKPAGEKAFEARVYASADDLPPNNDQQESVLVLVSDVVEWEVEYRSFVVDGKVATTSSYWRGENSTRNKEGVYEAPSEELKAAQEFARRVVKSKNERGFQGWGAVVDVGILRGFGWAVIEANPAWGAGIYGCDPQKVLQVISSCDSQER